VRVRSLTAGWPAAVAGVWLAALVALVVFGTLPFWVPVAYAVVSTVTFATYATDKAQAGANRQRVSERALHFLALAGGWPGAVVAQRYFRHKTRKPAFQVITWLIVAVHVLAIAWWCTE
jgi:uncharacterized membrane protein YsdA (DUF1294 family)